MGENSWGFADNVSENVPRIKLDQSPKTNELMKYNTYEITHIISKSPRVPLTTIFKSPFKYPTTFLKSSMAQIIIKIKSQRKSRVFKKIRCNLFLSNLIKATDFHIYKIFLAGTSNFFKIA